MIYIPNKQNIGSVIQQKQSNIKNTNLQYRGELIEHINTPAQSAEIKKTKTQYAPPHPTEPTLPEPL